MTTKAKKIVVIGAGVAGLSAGCYALMNGYDVEIFEAHSKCGGMCTSWSRRNFVFDYCVHNLAGTSEKTAVKMVWDELGALQQTPILRHEQFCRVEDVHGNVLNWYTDLDRLRSHIATEFREDVAPIDVLIRQAKKFAKADLGAMALGGALRTLKALPCVPAISRWNKMKLGQYAERLQHPFMKRAFHHLMYDINGDDVPMMALLYFMAGLSQGDFGWPVGGSQGLSDAIEKRVHALGGTIHYRKNVEEIMVRNDRAIGVRLTGGEEVPADRVVAAGDGYHTVHDLLHGQYTSETIEQYFSEAGDVAPFGVVVFLGLNRPVAEVPHSTILLFDEPFDVGEHRQDSMLMTAYHPDSGLTGGERSIIKLEVCGTYSYWKNLRDENRTDYRARKQQLAEMLTDKISHRVLGVKEAVEVIDVCTPPTAERYTRNRFGWQAGPPKANAGVIQRQGLSRTLPGLSNFHMVGQWSDAQLGVSCVAMGARARVKSICKADGRRFVTIR